MNRLELPVRLLCGRGVRTGVVGRMLAALAVVASISCGGELPDEPALEDGLSSAESELQTLAQSCSLSPPTWLGLSGVRHQIVNGQTVAFNAGPAMTLTQCRTWCTGTCRRASGTLEQTFFWPPSCMMNKCTCT